jgi:hypothetical protein
MRGVAIISQYYICLVIVKTKINLFQSYVILADNGYTSHFS